MKDDITLQVLSDKLDRIEQATMIGSKDILNLTEAAMFTGLSTGHLYRLTSTQAIPHFKKARKLYFKKQELVDWLTDTPIMTKAQINSRAETYISTRK